MAILLTMGLFPTAGFAVEGNEPATPSSIETPTPVPGEKTPEPSVTPAPTETPLSTPATNSSIIGLFGEELYAYLKTLEGDTLDAALAALIQEQIDSLEGYMTAKEAEAWFGFIQELPPLPVPPLFELPKIFARAMGGQVFQRGENPLKLKKTAAADGDDGGARLTLEAYTTGTVSTALAPADVVLVLDQSGSMGEILEGARTVANSYLDTTKSYYIAYSGGTRVVRYRSDENSWWRRNSDNDGWSSDGRVYPIMQGQGTSSSGRRYQFYADRSGSTLSNPVYPTLAAGTQYYIQTDSSNNFYTHVIYNETDHRWYRPNGNAVYPTLQGQSESTGSNVYTFYSGIKTRQMALLESVNAFMTELSGKANLEAGTLRIAMVEFANSADGTGPILSGNKTPTGAFVDVKTGLSDLIGVLNTMDELGLYTYPDTGLARANAIFSANAASYASPSTRARHVMLFTDGAPTGRNVYIDAIDVARDIKEYATIHTIGLLTGAISNANPSWNGWSGDFNYSSGTAGSTSAIDILLHSISSNFKNADAETRGSGNNVRVNLGARTGPTPYHAHYMRVGDADDLDQAFSDFLETLGGGLDNAKVRDVISQYFQLPSSVTASNINSHVKLYKQAYQGLTADENPVPVWGARVQIPLAGSGITISLGADRKAIDVTGYDFLPVGTANGQNQGEKFIVEFDVERATGFVGGNNVPTNASATVLDASGSEVLEFPDEPEVNVPIKYEFEPVDKSIYLGNSVAASSLYAAPDMSEANAWKYDYVHAPAFTISPTGLSPNADTTYTVTATITPKTDGSLAAASARGAANPMAGVPFNRQATVYVAKPTVTCKDAEMFLGDIALNWETHFDTFVDPVWNLPAGAPDLDETQKPTLKYAISLPTGVDTTEFTPILGGNYNFNISVAVDKPEGTPDIPLTEGTHVTIVNPTPLLPDEAAHHFTVKVRSGTIVINKTGGAAGDSYLFTVARTSSLPEGLSMYASSFQEAIQAGSGGSGTVTITGLPKGTYTVTEENGWSWRYEIGSQGWASSDNTLGDISADTDTITYNITNVPAISNWLSSECYAINKWLASQPAQ